jgi:hypothetical protein
MFRHFQSFNSNLETSHFFVFDDNNVVFSYKQFKESCVFEKYDRSFAFIALKSSSIILFHDIFLRDNLKRARLK